MHVADCKTFNADERQSAGQTPATQLVCLPIFRFVGLFVSRMRCHDPPPKPRGVRATTASIPISTSTVVIITILRSISSRAEIKSTYASLRTNVNIYDDSR